MGQKQRAASQGGSLAADADMERTEGETVRHLSFFFVITPKLAPLENSTKTMLITQVSSMVCIKHK